MKYKQLSASEKLFLIEQSQHGKSAKDIASELNVTPTTVRRWLRISKKSSSIEDFISCGKKYFFNEFYFDNVDTEDKAYFLGFLYADGYNDERNYSINLSLIETDIAILEKFKGILKSTRPLQYVKIKHKVLNIQNQWRLALSSKHMSQQLVKLGCMQAKTFKITFPNWLREDLLRHFIRGYFDGDGSISISKHRETFTMVGTESFLEEVQTVLMRELGLNKTKFYKRFPEDGTNITSLIYVGSGSLKKIMDWLYKDASYFLKRKHDTYTTFNEWYEDRRSKKIYECVVCADKATAKRLCNKHYLEAYRAAQRN